MSSTTACRYMTKGKKSGKFNRNGMKSKGAKQNLYEDVLKEDKKLLQLKLNLEYLKHTLYQK
jgi:hypothetical protein